MTFVSSFRPHSRNADYALNQNRAIASWRDKADQIILFGDHEPDLALDNVLFVPATEKWPTIAEMASIAAASNDTACILNADIFIGPTFRGAVAEWHRQHSRCGTSRRYEYEPGTFPNSLTKAKVVDMGFDFFMAEPAVWRKVESECPESMFIGHSLWDNWMLGIFYAAGGRQHRDMTRFRFVFHPRHEGRKQEMRVEIKGPYLEHHGWGSSL